MNTTPAPTTRAKRVRLKPELRAQLILRAALVEFGARGFAGTRIEDIARRAGLTKTGVYAHYPSKDAIFEALLNQVLLQANQDSASIWNPDGVASLPEMVDAYLENLYRMVQNPEFVELFRLLLTEGTRVPEVIRRWHEQVVQRYRAEEQALIDACVRRGLLRAGPLTELFSISAAPAFLWLVSKQILGHESAYPLAQVRRIHRAMLMEQLQLR